MENLGNSGNLRNCGKTQGNLNFCRKNLENSGKMKKMSHDRQEKCIPLNFPFLSCSQKNFKICPGNLREFGFSKIKAKKLDISPLTLT